MGIHVKIVRLGRLTNELSRLSRSPDSLIDEETIKRKIVEHRVFIGEHTTFILTRGVKIPKSLDDIFAEAIEIRETINCHLCNLKDENPLSLLNFKTLLLERYVDMIKEGGQDLPSDFLERVQKHEIHYRSCRVLRFTRT